MCFIFLRDKIHQHQAVSGKEVDMLLFFIGILPHFCDILVKLLPITSSFPDI